MSSIKVEYSESLAGVQADWLQNHQVEIDTSVPSSHATFADAKLSPVIRKQSAQGDSRNRKLGRIGAGTIDQLTVLPREHQDA